MVQWCALLISYILHFNSSSYNPWIEWQWLTNFSTWQCPVTRSNQILSNFKSCDYITIYHTNRMRPRTSHQMNYSIRYFIKSYGFCNCDLGSLAQFCQNALESRKGHCYQIKPNQLAHLHQYMWSNTRLPDFDQQDTLHNSLWMCFIPTYLSARMKEISTYSVEVLLVCLMYILFPVETLSLIGS